MNIRWGASLLLLVLYISNVVTGWRATTVAERYSPEHRAGFFQGFKNVLLYFFNPKYKILNIKDENIKEKVYNHLSVHSPYISTFGAVCMFIVHLSWFYNEYWRTQELLFPFLFSHYMVSLALHYFHFKVEFSGYERQRDVNDSNH